MSRSIIRSFVLAGAIGLASVAQATTLFTPPGTTPAGYLVYCEIANVSSSPIHVTTVELVQLGSGNVKSFSNSCGAEVAPGAGCYSVTYANSLDTVYCRFAASSSKVRASLTVGDQQGTPLFVLPATQ